MESTFRLRRSIIAAMLLALTLVLGRFFLIPIPWTHGNVNLCDAGVFIAAMLLGPGAGTIVGGFGGMFLDLIPPRCLIFLCRSWFRRIYQWLDL